MEFDYNTSREKLIFPEYGRHVQQMVAHAMTIEDREERNRAARAIIAVMSTLNPQLRDVNDFKQKLWDHLAVISDFKLDVDSPFPMPEAARFQVKPDAVPYPQQQISRKHYGRIIEDLIAKVPEIENKHMREQLIVNIANQMKKSYLIWNRDSVTDEEIFQDLYELSGGQVTMDPMPHLAEARNLVFKNPVKTVQQNGKKRKSSKKKN